MLRLGKASSVSAAEKWNKKKNLHEHDRKQMYAHKHTQIFKLSTLEDYR